MFKKTLPYVEATYKVYVKIKVVKQVVNHGKKVLLYQQNHSLKQG